MVPVARNDGFLWVISDLSTLRRDDVMAEPVLICAKTELISPPDIEDVGAPSGALGTPFSSSVGNGGGGGGGGPPEEDCAEALGVAVPD